MGFAIARTIRVHRTSHISLSASLVKKTVVNPFWPLTRFTRDHRTLNQPRACSRWQLQAAEWTARCRLKMVEVRKETGRDDSQLTLGSTYEPHLVGCSKRTPSPLTILAIMANMPS